jgi:hypothetical protein
MKFKQNHWEEVKMKKNNQIFSLSKFSSKKHTRCLKRYTKKKKKKKNYKI